MEIRRVIVVVLDGVGAGELPDADAYGDSGSDTLVHCAEAVGGLYLPNLSQLGLGNLRPIRGVQLNPTPRASYGRLRELSPGKDSVTGHWEMMGTVLDRPFPTYPNGFPPEIMEPFEAQIGMQTLGNRPASGTEIIKELGEEHVRTGRPIVYTSADSVFQIAAHEAVVPIERLYAMCETARRLLAGEHAVGRVIARPFAGEPGAYVRTERRKDYPLDPPRNLLDELSDRGFAAHGIGKTPEFFNGRGIATADHTTANRAHMAALIRAVRESDAALVFANFEDFDMLYGHRNDPMGFAGALEAFDAELPDVLAAMRADDLLLLTNDHGNDPTTPSTDHSREYAMLLAYTPSVSEGHALGDRETFADIAATIREAFELPPAGPGRSILSEMGVAS